MAMTPLRALVLEAYYSLLQEVPAEAIGSGEIRKWARKRRKKPPSEGLVRGTLIEHGLKHRVRGRPLSESLLYRGEDDDVSPFAKAVDESRRHR